VSHGLAAPRWTGRPGQQDDIEAKLGRRFLAPEPNPARTALFDLSSFWVAHPR
jgi:hypothetical protein